MPENRPPALSLIFFKGCPLVGCPTMNSYGCTSVGGKGGWRVGEGCRGGGPVDGLVQQGARGKAG